MGEIIKKDTGFHVAQNGACTIVKNVRFYASLLNEMAYLKDKKLDKDNVSGLSKKEEYRLKYLEIKTANGRILSAMSNISGCALYSYLKPATIKWVINSELSANLINCIHNSLSPLLNDNITTNQNTDTILDSGLKKQDIYDIYERLLFLKNTCDKDKNQLGIYMIKAG